MENFKVRCKFLANTLDKPGEMLTKKNEEKKIPEENCIE
jgi:hypothetical protein